MVRYAADITMLRNRFRKQSREAPLKFMNGITKDIEVIAAVQYALNMSVNTAFPSNLESGPKSGTHSERRNGTLDVVPMKHRATQPMAVHLRRCGVSRCYPSQPLSALAILSAFTSRLP